MTDMIRRIRGMQLSWRDCTRAIAGVAVMLIALNACKDLSAKLPAGVVDPKFYATPEAAEQMARGARYTFQFYALDAIRDGGLLADEFRDRHIGALRKFQWTEEVIDHRHLPENDPDVQPYIDKISTYPGMQRIRSAASLAERALAAYAPELPRALRSEMLSYEAYAVLWLADLYCAGVSFSSVDFNGDWTYRPGISTPESYRLARTLFDSAITLAGTDSMVFLARMGKARALLALGEYATAGDLAASIPSGFRFALPLQRGPGTAGSVTGVNWPQEMNYRGFVADRKGGNGLPFINAADPSAADPRVLLQVSDIFISSGVERVGRIPLVRTHLLVTSHIEARLIQAEAAINAGSETFLGILNALRTNGTFTVLPNGDTLYAAGSGGVAGLKPLIDPATLPLPSGKSILDVRIDLLMQERGYWLFANGVRQGDLRRLVRNYGRPIDTVYPTGFYRSGFGQYDDFVEIPIPSTERFNPHYRGCHSRGA